LRYFLTGDPGHILPPVDVDRILKQLNKIGEEGSLDEVLGKLAEHFGQSGNTSPRYLALIRFIESDALRIFRRLQASDDEAKDQAVAGVMGMADRNGAAVDEVLTSESPPPSDKFANIMKMDPADALRVFFPSMTDQMLKNVHTQFAMVISEKRAGNQKPGLKEPTPVREFIRYIEELVSNFSVLANDLAAAKISPRRASRFIFGCYQTNSARNEALRLEQARGLLPTYAGLSPGLMVYSGTSIFPPAAGQSVAGTSSSPPSILDVGMEGTPDQSTITDSGVKPDSVIPPGYEFAAAADGSRRFTGTREENDAQLMTVIERSRQAGTAYEPPDDSSGTDTVHLRDTMPPSFDSDPKTRETVPDDGQPILDYAARAIIEDLPELDQSDPRNVAEKEPSND
jgi:hypothetical protein